VADLKSELASAQGEVADLKSKLASAEKQLTDCTSALDQERGQVAEAQAMWDDFAAALAVIDVEKLMSFYAEDSMLFFDGWNYSSRMAIQELYEFAHEQGDVFEIKSVFGGTDWGALEGILIRTEEGREKRIACAAILECQDGKIIRHREYSD
jgi:hypothetical protein